MIAEILSDRDISSWTSEFRQEMESCLERLFALQEKSQKELESLVSAASQEYHLVPREKRTIFWKASFLNNKAKTAGELEKKTDQAVETLLRKMTELCRYNHTDTKIVSKIREVYLSQKKETKAQYLSMLKR